MGESWDTGCVVLAWDEVLQSSACADDGYNVVIHEFAHKLDMSNGAIDGMPALHEAQAEARWIAAFGPAFEDFRRRVDGGAGRGRHVRRDRGDDRGDLPGTGHAQVRPHGQSARQGCCGSNC